MKGEESAEAKIKSFDEVKMQFDFLVVFLRIKTIHYFLCPDSPEVQIHGEQPCLPEKKAENTGGEFELRAESSEFKCKVQRSKFRVQSWSSMKLITFNECLAGS